MIVEAIVGALVSVIEFALGLVPEFEMPEWLDGTGAGTLHGYATDIGEAASGGSYWVPFDAAALAVTIVLAAVAFSLLVRLFRLVLSLFTGGGGS